MLEYNVMKRNEFLQKVRRFTDDEFIKLYRIGLSDRKIATEFGVGHTATFRRRKKLGLIANYFPRLQPQELKNKYRQDNHKIYKISRNTPEKKEKMKKARYAWQKTKRARKTIKRYMGNYRQTEKYKTTTRKYLSKPETIKRRKVFQIDWWNRNGGKVAKIYAERRREKRWANMEEREIAKCNQILSGLLYSRKRSVENTKIFQNL